MSDANETPIRTPFGICAAGLAGIASALLPALNQKPEDVIRQVLADGKAGVEYDDAKMSATIRLFCYAMTNDYENRRTHRETRT